MFSLIKNQPMHEIRLPPALKFRRIALAIGIAVLGLLMARLGSLSAMPVLFFLAFLSGISSNWSA